MLSAMRLATILLVSTVFATSPISAQEYPNKVVHIVVPNAPGLTQDIVARVLAPHMAKFLEQPVIVENKPGAEYSIGLEYVAKQPADGYTIAIIASSNVAVLPWTLKNL